MTSCKHVLKTPWKTSWRRPENVLKTSWRHFRKTYCKYVLKTSSRRLQEVLEDEKCYAEEVFVLKTSWKTRNVCWAGISPFLQFVSIVFNYFHCWLWKIKCQLGYLKSIRNLLSFSSIVKNQYLFFTSLTFMCLFTRRHISPWESASFARSIHTCLWFITSIIRHLEYIY